MLDETVPLANILRQVLILGGHVSSQPLRAWAQRELKGYGGAAAEIPDYRKLPAQLKIDITNGPRNWAQEIEPYNLPKEAREHITGQVELPWGAAEIQAMANAKDEHIRLAMPGMSYTAQLMTQEWQRSEGPFVSVDSVFWSVSRAAITGVLDQIRTRLTEFVAEVRASMSPGSEEPTIEQIREAVSSINIRVGDNSPVTVTAPVAVANQEAVAGIPKELS